MSSRYRPSILFQPAAHLHFQRGARRMVAALRPTLGPLPRRVLVMPERGVGHAPELLDSGGLIARRMVQLADARADPGAMYVRHMVWRLHEEVGDGTVTAAVLFEELFDQGLRFVVAGCDPGRLRSQLVAGAELVCAELARQTTPLAGRAQIARAAESVGADTELATLLGEVFDIIGADGQLDIRPYQRSGVSREYVEGMVYAGGVLSRLMYTDAVRQRVELEHAALLLSDLAVDDPRDLVPAMEAALALGMRALVVIVDHLSDAALGLLDVNRRAGTLHTFAVRPPGLAPAEQVAALDDIAILTGGRPLYRTAGASLRAVTAADLGQARRAWADTAHFGLAGGKGDPRALRARIAMLRRAYAATTDAAAQQRLQQRLGRLMGGMATVLVGGATETEIALRKGLAQRTAGTLRGALRTGVLPGGGSALLACRPAMRAARRSSRLRDERAACDIWLHALEAPARAIAVNAGYDPGTATGRYADLPPGHGLEVQSGRILDMARAGILDSAAVMAAAVRTAAHAAALALTINAQVYRAMPETSIEP